MNEKEKSSVIEVIPCLGFYQIAGAIAKNCYSMHPFYNPDDVSVIIQNTLAGLMDVKTEDFKYAKVLDDFECLQDVKPAGFFRELNRILYSISAFRNLNLSQAEKNAGITDPDDLDRQNKHVFVSRFSHTDKDDEFIDLDACIRNIYMDILEECIDDEVADLRNKRFDAYPWLTFHKENEVVPHKELLEIETICGAIRGYFGGNTRWTLWEDLSNAEMNEHLDEVCSDLTSILLTKQEPFYKKRSSANLHFLGYDTFQDVLDLVGNLKDVPAFNTLNRCGRYRFGGSFQDMAEGHINEIAMRSIIMMHPSLSLSYLVDNKHVIMEEEKKEDEDVKVSKELDDSRAEASDAQAYSAHLSYIKGVIGREIYTNLLEIRDTSNLSKTVNPIVDAFVDKVLEIDKECKEIAGSVISWNIDKDAKFPPMVYFNSKDAVLHFFLKLDEIPEFMAINDSKDGKRPRPFVMIDHMMDMITSNKLLRL